MFRQADSSPLTNSETVAPSALRRDWGTKLVAASALSVAVLLGTPAIASAAPSLVEEGSYDEISTTSATDTELALVEEGSYDELTTTTVTTKVLALVEEGSYDR